MPDLTPTPDELRAIMTDADRAEDQEIQRILREAALTRAIAELRGQRLELALRLRLAESKVEAGGHDDRPE